MTDNKMQKWEITRQMGRWKYALIYGSIWGFFVSLFVFMLNYFFSFDHRKQDLTSIIIMVSIYWLTGIILYGFIFWKTNERRYQAWKNEQNE